MTWGVPLFVSYHFAFSYSSWGSQGKNTGNILCKDGLKTQQWPQDWKRSVFILIPKKGNAKECSNDRALKLNSLYHYVPNMLLEISGEITAERMKRPKQKHHPVVDVTDVGSKVQCCKEQYCIGTGKLGP